MSAFPDPACRAGSLARRRERLAMRRMSSLSSSQASAMMPAPRGGRGAAGASSSIRSVQRGRPGLALTVPAAVAGRKRAGLSVPAVAVRRAGTGFVRTACEGAVAHENLLSGCGRGAVGGKRRKQERRQSLIPILKAPAPQVREVMQLMSSFASGALMTPARGARPAGFARAGRSAGTNQQRCCDRADWC